jgi:hypothetical protein
MRMELSLGRQNRNIRHTFSGDGAGKQAEGHSPSLGRETGGLALYLHYSGHWRA